MITFLKLAFMRAGMDVKGCALSLLRAYSRLGDERTMVRRLFEARLRQSVRQTERLKQLGAVLERLRAMAP